MQEEKLLLTKRERDRLKVLHEVGKGQITQRQAAEQLKVSDRWIRELVARIGEEGDKAVIHGLRGQPSKRRISGKIEKRAVEIIGREYADFGPTLATEYLEREHGIAVSRETARQWMIRGGIWKKRKQRIEEVHVWRRRRSCFGELVQGDTSDHDWLEGRGGQISDRHGGRCDQSGTGPFCSARFHGGEHAVAVGVGGEVRAIRGGLYGSSGAV